MWRPIPSCDQTVQLILCLFAIYGLKFIPALFQPYSLQFHAHCLILLKMAIIEHYIRVSTVLPGKNLTNSPKYICYGVHFKENFGFNLATLIKIASTTDELYFFQVLFS